MRRALLLLAFLPCVISRGGELEKVALKEMQAIVPLIFVGPREGTRVKGLVSGTAFVVDERGLLATAYHVVLPAVMEPEKNGIYLRLDESSAIPARLVGFDIINDVALVAVDHEFARQFTISRLPPFPKQHLSSFGYANSDYMRFEFSRFAGRVTDKIRGIGVSALGFDGSVFHGMSGGPLLDVNDEVVGVNSQNRDERMSFASAALNVAGLIRRATPQDMKNGLSDPAASAEAQLVDMDRRLLEDWREESRNDPLQPGWRIQSRGSLLSCKIEQRDSRSGSPDYDYAHEYCVWRSLMASLTRRRSGGWYEVEYIGFTNHGFSPAGFLSRVRNEGEADWAVRMEWAGEPDGPSGDETKFDCRESERIIQVGVPVRFRFCVRPYPRLTRVWDGYAKLNTEIPGGAAQLVAWIRLHGLQKDTMNELVESWLSGIRLADDAKPSPPPSSK